MKELLHEVIEHVGESVRKSFFKEPYCTLWKARIYMDLHAQGAQKDYLHVLDKDRKISSGNHKSPKTFEFKIMTELLNPGYLS